jgi:arylsulfatase A-like enzyme
VVESVDIFPTLTDLCGLPTPDGLSGQSLRSYLQNPAAPSAKPALAWFTRGQSTIRTDDWRLIVHQPDAATQGMELFDFRTAPEGRRVDPKAEPAVVAQLRAQLPAPAALQPAR